VLDPIAMAEPVEAKARLGAVAGPHQQPGRDGPRYSTIAIRERMEVRETSGSLRRNGGRRQVLACSQA